MCLCAREALPGTAGRGSIRRGPPEKVKVREWPRTGVCGERGGSKGEERPVGECRERGDPGGCRERDDLQAAGERR